MKIHMDLLFISHDRPAGGKPSAALSVQQKQNKAEIQNAPFDLLHVLLIMLIKLICKLEAGLSCFWRGGGLLLDVFGRCSVVESNATNLPSISFY